MNKFEQLQAENDIKKHDIMNDLMSARDRVLDLCSQDGWPDEPIDPQLWAAAQKIIAASAFWHNIAAGIEIENIVLERSDAAAPEEPDHNVRAGQLRFDRIEHLRHRGHFTNAMEVVSVDDDVVRFTMKRGGSVYRAHADQVMQTHPLSVMQEKEGFELD